jgi:hypothetical protein
MDGSGRLGAQRPSPWVLPNRGYPKGAQDYLCRAAHESGFDLAYILELPVPPVVLWPEGAPDTRPIQTRQTPGIPVPGPQKEAWLLAERSPLLSVRARSTNHRAGRDPRVVLFVVDKVSGSVGVCNEPTRQRPGISLDDFDT